MVAAPKLLPYCGSHPPRNGALHNLTLVSGGVLVFVTLESTVSLPCFIGEGDTFKQPGREEKGADPLLSSLQNPIPT